MVVANLFAGTISPRLVTDAPGITVFCSALLVRAIFGGGRFKTSDKFISSGNVLGTTIVISAGHSLVVAGVYCGAVATGIAPEAFAGLYHIVIFGLAAVGLTFTVAGQPYYASCWRISWMTPCRMMQKRSIWRILKNCSLIDECISLSGRFQSHRLLFNRG